MFQWVHARHLRSKNSRILRTFRILRTLEFLGSLGAIHKGRPAKIEIFRPPLPRLSGVVRKLIPPSPAGRPTFWFTMERESPQTHAHALKHMITYSQTPENSNFHTHAWILIKITKKERINFFQFRTSEHLKPPPPPTSGFVRFFQTPPRGGRPDVLCECPLNVSI